jgi:hypothetical protein
MKLETSPTLPCRLGRIEAEPITNCVRMLRDRPGRHPASPLTPPKAPWRGRARVGPRRPQGNPRRPRATQGRPPERPPERPQSDPERPKRDPRETQGDPRADTQGGLKMASRRLLDGFWTASGRLRGSIWPDARWARAAGPERWAPAPPGGAAGGVPTGVSAASRTGEAPTSGKKRQRGFASAPIAPPPISLPWPAP